MGKTVIHAELEAGKPIAIGAVGKSIDLHALIFMVLEEVTARAIMAAPDVDRAVLRTALHGMTDTALDRAISRVDKA